MARWAAILAGGSGTRFWPLSTSDHPKQMLPLVGEKPLLREAVDRVLGFIPAERVLLLTGEHLRDSSRALLPELPEENFLAEPRPASTAPALTWATSVAARVDGEATILSLHADWHVGDQSGFRETCLAALEAAETHDLLLTVGIPPNRPETGYGYILPSDPIEGELRQVDRFEEKPNVERAGELIAQGALWNSGLFAWTAKRFLEQTSALAPEIAPHLNLLEQNRIVEFFDSVTPIAVDVSHFERSDRIGVLAARFEWDDVGTWAALPRVSEVDDAGNLVRGTGYVSNGHSCVIWGEGTAVVVDGVDDIVAVSANGVTLVTTRERSADLKRLLSRLPPEIRDRLANNS